ncbi:MAG: PD40 domain-containing protein [Sphingobacteriales bacterium]|nr:PD40 domain-containing protein [Sphingobacteriales bacterium]
MTSRRSIAYDRPPDPLINSSIHSDIALLDITARTSTPLIANPSSDDFLAWSPEGDKFIYASNVNDTTPNFYTNNRLFIYDMASHSSREIATDFDEDKFVTSWNKKGIFFMASQKTKAGVFQMDPSNGRIEQVSLPVDIVGNASYTKDGSVMAFSGRAFDGLSEIYIGND